MEQARGQAAEGAVEQVAIDLLEALESLATVYECADQLTRCFTAQDIATYALGKLMDVVEAAGGVFYLEERGELVATCARGGAIGLLRPDAPVRLAEGVHKGFLNGRDAAHFFSACEDEHSLLHAPIRAGGDLLGLILLLSPAGRRFDTADHKLLSTVSAQVAIALSALRHYRDVVTERAKLRSIVEKNGEGILVLSPDAEVIYANAVGRAWLELPAGDPPEPIALATHLAAWRCNRDLTTLAGGACGDLELELVIGTAPRERFYAGPLRCLRDSEGRLVNLVLSLRDLSEQRREERLKSDFLTLISHKLRTPLTIVAGALPMLADEDSELAPSPAERYELLEEVGRNVDQLAVLIERLLTFVEVLRGTWSCGEEQRTFEDEVRAAFEVARQRYPDRPARLDILPGGSTVDVPLCYLRAMFENLLENAIKFGRPEGVWIRVSSDVAEDGSARIRIEDDGIGIEPGECEKIFESFYQCEEEFTGSVQGVGLGLALVRAILGNLGGAIEVTSQPGAGSCFTLTLPPGEAPPRLD